MIFIVAIVCGCHREADPWKESDNEKEIAVYVRSSQSTATPPTTGYRLFLFNSKNQLSTHTIQASEVTDGNRFKLEIPEGSYTGYCITNGEDERIWEYSANSTPSRIYVTLLPDGDYYQEAGDYLAGKTEFSIGQDNPENILFDLERKVGCIRVIIENIPSWMNNLHIQLSGIPEKMNLSGTYSGDRVTLDKAANPPDASGRSTTDLLVFPPGKSSNLTLTYQAGVASETSIAYTLDSILSNHITEIKAIFQTTENNQEINFSTEISAWNENIIREKDWYIELPGMPCQGNGDGINLVRNGSFEDETSGTIPADWKLDGGGSDKIITSVTSPVIDGNQAVRLEGKTYLYQDIEVQAGTCYRFHLFVNSPSADVKWRHWGTWMNGTKKLDSDAIRESSYRNKTEGYEDVYAGTVFKAPEGATKLRMEIRSYTDRNTSQEGIYVDAVSIEKIE